MDGPNQTRLFTIGEAVSELRATYPDTSHSSLRFLQREGMVSPMRTVGGHRLYTPGDLDRVRQIKRWQKQRLSLQEIRQRLEKMDGQASTAQISRRFLDLAIVGDLNGAAQAVLHADDLGLPLAQTFDEVLRPALVEVGERWATGVLTVAQEHEVSQLTQDLIATLSHRHAPVHGQEPVVVATCVADEQHELGLRMLCAVLRQRGARLHYLGASVSPPFLVEAVQERRPDILLLSVSLTDHLPALRSCLAALNAAWGDGNRPLVVAGGRGTVGAVDELEALGADAVVGATLVEQAADAILERWRPGS